MSSLALNKVSRGILIAAVSAAFVAGGVVAAQAVTNPADNPYPVTVLGDDGNTYHDGADTLPGYDDEECTYIPGAWFDFANNRVHYADGQSIPWTEWDRASGYREWLANHNSQQNTGGNQNSNQTATPTTSTGHTKTTKTKAQATAIVKTAAKTQGVAGATNTTATTVVGHDTASNTLNVSVGQNNSQNPGRETGLIILFALLAGGVLLTSLSELKTRFGWKEKA